MKGQFKREVVVDQSFQIKSNGLSDAMVPPQLNDVPKTEYHKLKKIKKNTAIFKNTSEHWIV